MSRAASRLCLLCAISFIAGFLCSPIAVKVWKAKFVTPVHRQRREEAYSFLYATMNELLQGTYNPEEDYVSQRALNTFKEYGPRLGGKCRLYIRELSAGDFGGEAFFPSGDIFDVMILRSGERWVLHFFYPDDWDQLWRDAMGGRVVPWVY